MVVQGVGGEEDPARALQPYQHPQGAPGVAGQAHQDDVLKELLVAIDQGGPLAGQEGEVRPGEAVLVPLQVQDAAVLVLMEDDLHVGVLEEAEAAGVVHVHVAHDDVAEVLRPQPQGLEPRLQEVLRPQVVPLGNELEGLGPLLPPVGAHPGLEQDAPLGVLDDVGQAGALVAHLGLDGLSRHEHVLGVAGEEHLDVHAHVAQLEAVHAYAHGLPPRKGQPNLATGRWQCQGVTRGGSQRRSLRTKPVRRSSRSSRAPSSTMRAPSRLNSSPTWGARRWKRKASSSL
ncbi:hypothetical protein HRbin25_00971 [bacterium HR25]|nr:hypothetical protein HRbin25_00971 [bacterium HR25]